jgi:hypothetical protein
MAIDQECGKEITKRVDSELPPRGFFGARRTFVINSAKLFIEQKINAIRSDEMTLNIVDFIRTKHPGYIAELDRAPPCIRRYSVKECVDLYFELRNDFY